MIGLRGFSFWTGWVLTFICFASAVKVTEDNLKNLLTESEWKHVMGETDTDFSIVYPRLPGRHRRSLPPGGRHLELHAPALRRRFSLSLTPSPALTTEGFRVVATWSNRSEDLPMEMAATECYYRGAGSALSLCGGVRGIVSSDNNEYFIIHPLPARLQTNDSQPHIIIRRPASHPYTAPKSTPLEPEKPICAHDDSTEHNSRKYWTKHRRKKYDRGEISGEDNQEDEDKKKRKKYYKEKNYNEKNDKYNLKQSNSTRTTRSKRALLAIGSPVFVETAVFVDRDLFQHMRANYPTDTERELVRFVLAMINAVQLLYHDPSLGRPVFFVLKRLEILHEEPSGLSRPHDIDRFLSSFCSWQRLRNPAGDADPQHWDHALILTGLDLYVVGKRGKVSSQVVGLAPVAGMCTMTSSCTVNEGRHFESVYVVAHEIGHNFLSSFCSWQRLRNPAGDADPQHWDHALILTGLDLYVVGKRGKVSSQVVVLAPVAGMCTMTSSCTVNEGRHFESVYVVAHEIGHNLGMRHDGPLADNDCDPSSYIMSPTLGSGKITWSPCSRRYLQKFLETSQSRCLLDHGSSAGQLDHSAEGALPGERFDADQQCMLKYGRGSKHSSQQPLDDVCRDLHCQRERYTWTSHPALEGTTCGHQQWCRGGRCVARGHTASYTSGGSSSGRSGAVVAAPGPGGLSGNIDGGWSDWKPYSDCASGCLYGEEGRLRAGSTGIMVSTRRCNRPRPEGSGRTCQGPDRRHQACSASQCLNVPRMTVREFAVQICERAREVDTDLTGAGLQRTSSDPEEACMVWCLKRNGDTKNRGWTFPDGTVCQTRRQRFGRQSYCINGRCEDFDCARLDTDLTFLQHPDLCPVDSIDSDNELGWRGGSKQRRRDSGVHWVPASGCHFNCMAPGTGVRLVVSKSDKRRSSIQLCQPDKMDFDCARLDTDLTFLQHPDLCPVDAIDSDNELGWRGGSKQRRRDSGVHWVPASGCHFNCMAPGTGVRLVVSKSDKRRSSIQLCQPDKMGCGRIKSPYQHATTVCSKYKERVRRLSGLGMQISAAIEDPDRPCRVACQDENVSHRFYLVNGEDGWFPFGTDCARGVSEKRAFCISGKCLEFGPDETPLSENEFTLPLLSRSRRSLETNKTRVIATLQQQDLDLLISKLNISLSGPINAGNTPQLSSESYDIDLTNPVFVEMTMPPYAMQPNTYYRENEVNISEKDRFTAK